MIQATTFLTCTDCLPGGYIICAFLKGCDMAGLGALLRKILSRQGSSLGASAGDCRATREDGMSSGVLHCRAQVEQQPKNAQHRFVLALALAGDGQLPEAVEAYRHAIRLQPRLAAAHANLGLLLQELGLPGVENALRQACTLVPDNPVFAQNLRLHLSGKAPMWHFSMMNDVQRNEAYRQALERVVRPGDHVLDIGTGSGLLALMAARAGARRVTSCEMVPEIAAKARQIITANGQEKRIRVIDKPSSELQIPEDMPERADVLVSEIFSSELIGEDVLPSFEHAREHLLKKDARIIPAQGWIVGQLAGAAELESYLRVGTVAGFDLSAFNEFSPVTVFPTEWNIDLDYQSEPFDIFSFDFQQEAVFPAQSRSLQIPVIRSGLCHGVLQWIRLCLHDEIFYENSPGIGARSDHAGHWRLALHTFPAPLMLEAGQHLKILAQHNRKNVTFRAEN